MKNLKSIYTKVHFGEQTFAQMPHKDISNLYINSISFFLIFNNKKLSRNTRKSDVLILQIRLSYKSIIDNNILL